MKFKVLVLSTLLSLSTFADVRSADEGVSDADQLIYQVRLKMKYGNSTFSDTFPEAGSSPLRINFVKESSCPRSPGMNIFVRHADSGLWEQTRFQNNLDYYSGGTINAIRFDITQSTYSSTTCTWKVYAANGPVEDPIFGGQEEILLGALTHNGGFAKDVTLALDAPKMLTHIRFEVPEYCRNLQVLEAATVTEGIADKAKLVSKDKLVFAVHNGDGARISKVTAALNSIAGQSCSIPVYGQEKRN